MTPRALALFIMSGVVLASIGVGMQLDNLALLSTQAFRSLTANQQSPQSSTLTLNSYWLVNTPLTVSVDASLNMFTRLERGGDSGCLFVLSDGEIIGNGGPAKAPPIQNSKKTRVGGGGINSSEKVIEAARRAFGDTPPITFFQDGSIVAQTKEIYEKNNVAQSSILSNAVSTWSDAWSTETTGVTCSTKKNFAVSCDVESSIPGSNLIQLEVQRKVESFTINGTEPKSNIRKPTSGTMTASIEVTADELRKAQNCSPNARTTPTPIVTTTPIGTPETQVPTSTPTFTPAPTPTGGDSGGDDIFQTDGL